ncbi:MAG: 2Fe-2S iron-sulfur cluster-binding protein [Maritimibacter sp.]
MPAVTFIAADGTTTKVEAAVGTSVMEAARDAGLDEIIAECGGAMACATCHVHVAPDWRAAVGAAGASEADMLDFAASPTDEGSRLSCQIALSEALDGLVVHLPDSQV